MFQASEALGQMTQQGCEIPHITKQTNLRALPFSKHGNSSRRTSVSEIQQVNVGNLHCSELVAS